MTSADIFNQQFLIRMNVGEPERSRAADHRASTTSCSWKATASREGMLNKPFVVPANGETDFDMTVRDQLRQRCSAACCRG